MSPRPSHVFVGDLFRQYKPQQSPEPKVELDESPRERSKAKALLAQHDPHRTKAVVSDTQTRFRKTPDVQNLLTVFESVCSTVRAR